MIVALSDIILTAKSKRKNVSTCIPLVNNEPFFLSEIETFCRTFAAEYPDIKTIRVQTKDAALRITVSVPDFQHSVEK